MLACAIRECTTTMKKRKGGQISCPGYEMDCPKGPGCSKGGVYNWPKSIGFGNPYKHLLHCCYGGKPESLNDAYWLAYNMRAGADILTYYPPSGGYSAREESIWQWIELIVFENLPVHAVVSERWRRALKQNSKDEKVAKATVKKVMYKMVELIEKDIGSQMKRSEVGSLMYDGWTKDSMHFVGVIATFMRDYPVRKKTSTVHVQEPEMVLLSVAPMERDVDKKDEEDEDEDEDEFEGNSDDHALASSFTAKDQCEHLKKIIRYYGVEFDDWCACLIGDNAAVNIKTSRLCGVPHIGCKNHKLNLEINRMINLDRKLEDSLEKLQRLMVSLKTMKNSAALDAYTHLRPSLYVKTRWSGKYHVCRKFLKLREYLVAMHEDRENPFRVNTEDRHLLLPVFKQTIERYVKMLGFMQLTNEALQQKCIKLADAQMHLDTLTCWIAEGNASQQTEKHWAKGCHLGGEYIGKDSNKVVNKDFHNGVIKIQDGDASKMTHGEAAAVASLRKDAGKVAVAASRAATTVDARTSTTHAHGALQIAYNERIDKKRKERADEQYGDYRNCDFILGSAAEIERVWSAAEKILTSDRFRTHPILLETILFLRFNKKYWNKHTVMQAIKLVKEDDSNERYEKEVGSFGLLDEEVTNEYE